MKSAAQSVMLTILFITFADGCIAATPKEAIVKIRAGFECPDGQKKWSSTGSGFLVSKDGIVVTAKHVGDIKPPDGTKLVLEGASPSKDSAYSTLYPYDPTPTTADITTLRFSSALRNDWPFLNVSFADPQEGADVVAWGFPGNEERIGNAGKISGVQGLTPTLLPMTATVIEGMSGGPVIDAGNGTVIGVITGGAKLNGEVLALNYMTPIKYDSVGLQEIGIRSEAEPDSRAGGLSGGRSVDKFGPLASTVLYGTNLAAAAWGLRTAALGKGLWEPSVEDFPRAPVRMAGVIALVLIGLVFAFSGHDHELNHWVPWAVGCVVAAVVLFLMDVGLRSALIVRCAPRDRGFFGGIWLTSRARDIVRGAKAAYERQDLAPEQQPPSGPRALYCSFPATHREKQRVWSQASMSAATVLIVGAYVLWNALTTVAVAVAATVVALSLGT